ncbi:MAG TPA: hypothetical protein VMY36_02735 [Patescibacteria group bacterium]|nr:hypothetical protein [Patescibacteria group bacterium]
MNQLEELEQKLGKYQEEYSRLQKSDKVASARYGNEFRDLQMRVLESMIVEIKKEIVKLKSKGK